MDIQKDEAFELAFSKTNFYKGMVESLKNKDCPFESVFEIRNGKYRSSYVQLSHEIWQAAQAVPEGFVLMPKESNRDLQFSFEKGMLESDAFFGDEECFRDGYKAMVQAYSEEVI